MDNKVWAAITEYFYMRSEAAEAVGDKEFAHILRRFYYDMYQRVEGELKL